MNEENTEIEKEYGERAKTLLSEYIKYEGPEQFYEPIMINKKDKVLRFKDEE